MIEKDLNEFRRLIKKPIEVGEFYVEFLQQLIELTNAQAGIIWDCSSDPFTPVADFSNNGVATRINISPDEHAELLRRTLSNDSCIVVRPAPDVQAKADSPCFIICPTAISSKEIVELIVGTPESAEKERHLFASVKEACEIASSREQSASELLVGTQDAGNLSESKKAGSEVFHPGDVDDYVNQLHSSIDKRLTCANAANETRRLLKCDRVSVVLRKRGKFVIQAISGQVTVNRRSNTVQLLQRFTNKILKTEDTFWYPENDVPPQIANILDSYLVISATRSLIIKPIFEQPSTLVAEDPESLTSHKNSVIGGIVYEHYNEVLSKELHGDALEFTAKHAGNSIRNATTHHQLFLYPVWNVLGKSKLLMAPRLLPKTVLAALAILVAAIFLRFCPAEFYTSCDGVLVPQKIQRVFSNVPGVVEEVRTAHAKEVKKDDLLVSLTSEDLDLRIQQNRGAYESLKNQLDEIRDARIHEPGRASSDSNISKQSQLTLEAQLASLKNEREILTRMESDLAIRSPMDGVVITWDVVEELTGRPIQPQNMLMEIADVEGEWELELQMLARKSGHFLNFVKKNGIDALPPVTFILAADAKLRYEGKIIEIGESTEISAEQIQTISIRVKLDEEALPVLQAGTDVKARVYSGRTSLGYLWFHEIPEFLNRNVYFYLAR